MPRKKDYFYSPVNKDGDDEESGNDRAGGRLPLNISSQPGSTSKSSGRRRRAPPKGDSSSFGVEEDLVPLLSV